MTLTAAKRFHIPDPELQELGSSASEPAVAESFDGHPEAHLDGWHELPCQLDAAEHEPLEDIHASFHEQLAVLVRALASEDEPKPQAAEDGFGDEPELDEETELVPPEVDASDGKPWYSDLRARPLASVRSILDGRGRGFVIGISASIAAGGAMFAFANGIGEPPAVATGNIENAPLIITASAAISPEPPLRTAMAGENVEFETVGASAGRTDIGEIIAADSEPRADNRASVPGTFVQPAIGPEKSDGPPEFTQPGHVSETVVVNSGELDRGNNGQGEPPAKLTTDFETTVQPAAKEIELTASALVREHPIGQTAHAIKHVNLRAGPDNAAAVLAIIPEGSPIEVIQCEHWCEVISEGRRGWVYKDLISGGLVDEVSSVQSPG